MAMREEVAAGNPCLKISKKVRAKIPARNKRDRFMSLEEEGKLLIWDLLVRVPIFDRSSD